MHDKGRGHYNMAVRHTYDIAVLGATAAGYAAAASIAGAGRDVVVVDSPRHSVECPLLDWAPEDFFALRGLPAQLARKVEAQPFFDVTYHSTALDRRAEYHERKAAGYFLANSALVEALASAAAKKGAKVRQTATSPAIRLEEDGVQVLGTSQVSAKVLIVAQNRPEDIITDLSLPVRNVPQSPIVAAALDIPLAGRAAAKGLAGALHVVQSHQRGELAMFFACGNTLHLRVIRSAAVEQQYADELTGMMTALQKAGILPADLAVKKARGAVWHPPSGVALELETHVAKRCLLTGTAGGFADSITGATLATTVKSALLAAQTAMEALDNPDPQGTLTRYKTSWRRSLAEFLRPPNTSLAMLMPLLFVNSRIAAKFTHALLHGQSI
ncbi:MAG: NAD(P)/FAD-dependent oxidoreductase [Phycisphaerae bacterium]